MNTANNSRYKLSAWYLEQALVRLLKKKNVSDISVRELCDTAGVNRSTFYAHYADIFGMIAELLTQKFSAIQILSFSEYKDDASVPFERYMTQRLTPMLEAAKQNRELCLAYLEDANTRRTYEEAAHVFKADMIQFYVRTDKTCDTLAREYKFEAMHAAFFAIIRHWLKNGCTASIPFIQRQIQENVLR